MQIKEAAARSALTERAVRLYEERGLISPHIENKNGRDFRDYSDHDLERLKIISALRRALFTIDEIKTMLDDPSKIPEITEANRARIHTDFVQLSYLNSRMEAVDTSAVADAGELSRAIFAPAVKTGSEPVTVSSDVERCSEEYRRIYDKYFAENTGWDMRYSASLRISGIFGAIFSKKTVKVFLITLAVIAALAFLLTHIPYIESFEYTYTGVCLVYTEDAWLTDITEIPADETLTVHGRIKYYLFRDPIFDGYLELSGFNNASTPDEPGRFTTVIELRKSHPHPDEIPLELLFGFNGHPIDGNGELWRLDGTTEYYMNTVIIRARNYMNTSNPGRVYIFSRTGEMETAQSFYRFAAVTH